MLGVCFSLCKCPNWEYACELDNFYDCCLFYKDLVTFCGELINKLILPSKVVRIIRTFNLFFRILNYWNGVNKKAVDDFFELMPTYNHTCL